MDEVDFLHADKHQTILQVIPLICADEHHVNLIFDTVIFDGCGQACLKYSK